MSLEINDAINIINIFNNNKDKDSLEFRKSLLKEDYDPGRFYGNIIFELLKLKSQPLHIESAPKDGTVIDIFNKNGRVTDVYYDIKSNKFLSKNSDIVKIYYSDATHWLPIPQVKGE